MNILMLTNTYAPHVGGVANSVTRFAEALREKGHRVLVVAPESGEQPKEERDVVRVPAVQNFNGSDFAVPVPVTVRVAAALKEFSPQVAHSHHPFLLGDTALRVGASRGIPVVFTHHTMYEKYTHYVPGDSPKLKRFVVDMTTGYCNLCDAVVAPSGTVADILKERGVASPIAVIPTGVDGKAFEGADGAAFRRAAGIPEEAFLVGHVGRLAPEKNMGFLSEAVAGFIARRPEARFLLVGDGPSREEVLAAFHRQGLSDRVHAAGVLAGRELASSYKAMDAFAFASLTETQGMVLTEAMTAGVPVVAIDGPGVREVVRDGENGRLLPRPDPEAFRAALDWIAAGNVRRESVAASAGRFSMARSSSELLALYESLSAGRPAPREIDSSVWTSARNLVEKEWEILRNLARAAGEAVRSDPEEKDL